MSQNDDPLASLRNVQTPEPSASAGQRALESAMLAFDAEQKKVADAPQAFGLGARLRSIFASFGRTWTMDMRIPLGTAAVALLLLPLGYQLYTTTAFTPVVLTAPRELAKRAPEAATSVAPAPVAPARAKADAPAAATADDEADFAIRDQDAAADLALQPAAPEPQQAGAPLAQDTAAPSIAAKPAPPAGMRLRSAMPDALGRVGDDADAAGIVSETPPVSAASIAAPTEPSGDVFTSFTESPVKVTAEEPVSTFSIDVDTASYSYVRRMLTDGYLPEPDSVRIEEMVNYFPYSYPAPANADTPFQPTISVLPTPWNPRTQLVEIGIKGYAPPAEAKTPANLVFLIDTSGSMDEPDKLPLLRRAFALLVNQLAASDTVSIVTYAGSAGVVLEPTKASDKAAILGALDRLDAGGSTAGAEGIALAYQLAEQNKVSGGVNRVILATDGDFNVGISDPDQLVDFIKGKRDAGVFLSVLGFGQGNLDDATMQALAQNGNGNASYIDNFKEAEKVLVAEGGSTLETIAKDVKIQVEFNPAAVSEYRLVGYETRALNREDFNNDKVDAGDVGAGHTVTAIYEITPAGTPGQVDPLRYGTATPPAGQPDELGFLKLRYKQPDSNVSQLIELPIRRTAGPTDITQAGGDQRFAAAVAAFGQKLKGSNHAGDITYAEIAALAQGARGSDVEGYRTEFIQLVRTAARLSGE